ncbi:hypothetical protein TRIUR3_28169 [Triticum urartu]|uniref:Uncharacterized protein n=1 Tax=Triticum urartu TaxID=4572 RepID=M7YRI9_TRIUA|nr:hypothetical protein TRIUR3_28169 [Triticum urartu]
MTWIDITDPSHSGALCLGHNFSFAPHELSVVVKQSQPAQKHQQHPAAAECEWRLETGRPQRSKANLAQSEPRRLSKRGRRVTATWSGDSDGHRPCKVMAAAEEGMRGKPARRASGGSEYGEGKPACRTSIGTHLFFIGSTVNFSIPRIDRFKNSTPPCAGPTVSLCS